MKKRMRIPAVTARGRTSVQSEAQYSCQQSHISLHYCHVTNYVFELINVVGCLIRDIDLGGNSVVLEMFGHTTRRLFLSIVHLQAI